MALPDPRAPGPPPGKEELHRQIVEVLEGYRLEAEDARRGGVNPRDDKFKEALDLYWNRWDFSQKAPWQAQESMPEVPSFVDRFAAGMKEAMVATPDSIYTVVDPTDQERDLADAVKRMLDVWLSRCGRNSQGTQVSFPAVFEEQMKLGALMACCASVTWKEDVPNGRVAIETVDPQMVWLDHTYRNLYRLRRSEIDKHELLKMAREKDSRGSPIWNLDAINALTVSFTEAADMARKERLTGASQEKLSNRVVVTLDEYLATVLDREGKIIEDQGLFVVANNKYLVRGPEKNPFTHGLDWLVYAPLVTVPLSPYGRSYMEDFGSVAKIFQELTNMILDAVRASTIRAYAVIPSLLLNPEQLAEGLWTGKTLLLEDSASAKDFAQMLELGALPREAVEFWQAIKSELREAAGINEIGLGQFAPNSRTSATEVAATQQSSSALIRSVAQTIETRFLEPVLNLAWKTGIQHVRRDDPALAAAAGFELFGALLARRKELLKRPFTFQARGISTLIAKQQMLQRVMQVLQIVASNELLLQAFLQQIDVQRFMEFLLMLSNVDITKMQPTERQKLLATFAQPLQNAQAGARAQPEIPGDQEGAQIASLIMNLGGTNAAQAPRP